MPLAPLFVVEIVTPESVVELPVRPTTPAAITPAVLIEPPVMLVEPPFSEIETGPVGAGGDDGRVGQLTAPPPVEPVPVPLPA